MYFIFQAAPLFLSDNSGGIRSRTFYQDCVRSSSCICSCSVLICFPLFFFLNRTMAPVSTSIWFRGKKKFLSTPHPLLPISMGELPISAQGEETRSSVIASVSGPALKPMRAPSTHPPHYLIHILMKLKAGSLKFILFSFAQPPFLSSGCSDDYVWRSDTHLFLALESW